ncbi:hypothetical protein V1478_012181 [Vespula squamosa]|uniref:Uncharacterized protein n=1 Tax=Vespula squamosa TaxID=30214 RepID=A0ABD2ACQ3_VESSQ
MDQEKIMFEYKSISKRCDNEEGKKNGRYGQEEGVGRKGIATTVSVQCQYEKLKIILCNFIISNEKMFRYNESDEGQYIVSLLSDTLLCKTT